MLDWKNGFQQRRLINHVPAKRFINPGGPPFFKLHCFLGGRGGWLIPRGLLILTWHYSLRLDSGSRRLPLALPQWGWSSRWGVSPENDDGNKISKFSWNVPGKAMWMVTRGYIYIYRANAWALPGTATTTGNASSSSSSSPPASSSSSPPASSSSSSPSSSSLPASASSSSSSSSNPCWISSMNVGV